jgi:hypothetical protein
MSTERSSVAAGAGLLELPTTVLLGARSECGKDRCKMCVKAGHGLYRYPNAWALPQSASGRRVQAREYTVPRGSHP